MELTDSAVVAKLLRYLPANDGETKDTIIALSTDSLLRTKYVPTTPLQPYYFRPVVFDSFQLLDSIRLPKAGESRSLNDPIYGWLVTDDYHNNLMRRAKQSFIVNCPESVRFDEARLPNLPANSRLRSTPRPPKS